MDDLNTISLIAWLALFATLGTVLMVWWARSAMAALSTRIIADSPARDVARTRAFAIPGQ
jgi:hypothetical protein